MKNVNTLFCVLAFWLVPLFSNAQHDGVKLILDVNHPFFQSLRLTLYENIDSSYVIGINRNFRYDSIQHHYKFDNIVFSNKAEFNRLMNKAINLPVQSILNNLNTSAIYTEATVYTLQIKGFVDAISYSSTQPDDETEKRHLEEFVELCDELIKLANLDSDNLLIRKPYTKPRK
jgi:hypothetical protein